ncbi:MAG: hypothetical protein ACJA0Q_000230 [Saprospiraceae bacterium]|jgi:hypothetical protein
MKESVKNILKFFLKHGGLCLGAVFILVSGGAFSQNLRKVTHQAFKRGEVLEYKASYGVIDAARAKLTVMSDAVMVGKRSTYHVVGTGKSLGAFSWLFKVKDRYESFIDDKAMVPWVFLRRVHEGGFVMKRNIYFNQYKHTAKVKNLKDKSKKKYDVEPNAQDLLSSFYFARTLDLQNAKIGQEFTIPTFFDHENYPMKLKFLGKEVIKTSLGKFNCLKFVPLLQEGRVFKAKESMTIWLSDDQNKVPIRLKTNLLIGSVKLDLDSYSGLIAPLSEIKEK